MQDETQVDKVISPELSPAEIVSQMSKRADEIITDSETTEAIPSAYYGVSKSTSETGIETASLRSSSSGAGLNRTRDPVSGVTSYELSVLYHATGDRGAHVYSWTSLEPVVNYRVDSEMNGRSEPVPGTSPKEIKTAQSLIEQYFPEQQAESESVRQSFSRKVLARLRKPFTHS